MKRAGPKSPPAGDAGESAPDGRAAAASRRPRAIPPSAEESQTQKRALRIAQTLRRRIVRGELADGEPLPIEAQLMAEFEVSRATIREALRLLEVEGLLAIRRGPGGGPRVRRPPIAVVANAVGIQLQLDDVPLVQVWELRTELVERSIETLAAGPSAEIVGRLELMVDQLAGVEQEADVFPRRWIDLTEEAVRLAGNHARLLLVRALHEITLAQLLVSRYLAEPAPAAAFRMAVVSSWARIVAAITDNDVTAALDEFRWQSGAFGYGTAHLLGNATAVDMFSRES